MQVNSISNYNFGSSSLAAHRLSDKPQPECKDTPQPEQPVENQGVTKSLYFTGRKEKNDKTMRNAAMAGLGSLIILVGSPSLTSCMNEVSAEAYAEAEANANVSDTLNHHIQHDTIEKWIREYQKPIPLDTLSKISDNFDIPTQDIYKKNIINYEGTREWEYGNQFVANIDLLESSKNRLVYDREDLDWNGNHTGWGKDVYRIPTSNFNIETYDGEVLHSPKGMFYETYTNPWDQKTTVDDNNLVQRYFFQTIGDHVRVFSYDPDNNLYREDGEIGKGYLDKNDKGNNIKLTDLIASNPSVRWSNDPEFSTEDHVVDVKLKAVDDEELKQMYLKEREDDYTQRHNGNVQ